MNLAKQQGNAFGVSYGTAAKTIQSAIVQQKSLNTAIADMKLAGRAVADGPRWQGKSPGLSEGSPRRSGTTEAGGGGSWSSAAKLGGDFLATMNAATQMKPQIDAAKMSVTSFMGRWRRSRRRQLTRAGAYAHQHAHGRRAQQVRRRG